MNEATITRCQELTFATLSGDPLRHDPDGCVVCAAMNEIAKPALCVVPPAPREFYKLDLAAIKKDPASPGFGPAKKVRVDLVPPALTIGAAVALEEGLKYGAYEWRNDKIKAMEYVGKILRHLYAYVDGQDVDPSSSNGKTHLQGVAGDIAVLLDAVHGGFLIDDRPPDGPAPMMLAKAAA